MARAANRTGSRRRFRARHRTRRCLESLRAPRHSDPLHNGGERGLHCRGRVSSGAQPEEIVRAACSMRFADVARWSLSRMGFVVSERMKPFLQGLLKHYRFEEMRIPLGVVATDLCTGEPVSFRDTGDVFLPIRASCSYPGLFQPVRSGGRVLIDGAMSIEIPAVLARELGATHVVSVHLPAPSCAGHQPTCFKSFVDASRSCRPATRIAGGRRAISSSHRISRPSNGMDSTVARAGESRRGGRVAVLPAIQSWFSAVPCECSTDSGLSKSFSTASVAPESA